MVKPDKLGFNAVIPTYKRADKLLGKDYFFYARFVLPESQAKEYGKVLPAARMIVIPDKSDGNIVKKRNWVIENVPRPLLMIDDDVKAIVHSEFQKDRGRVKQKNRVDPGPGP